jgi:retron-type reverse transcriptase
MKGFIHLVNIINNRDIIHNELTFPALISIKSLREAFVKFSRCKKSRPDVSNFIEHLDQNLAQLHNDLSSGKYTHGGYQIFTINDPKTRKIHKASVRDRIVHQALVSAIEPLFDCRFIFDSYSCRTGKGTHAAVQRLRVFLRQASQNNTRKIYALKLDIRQFFASIDHIILLSLIEQRVKDERTLALIRDILSSMNSETGIGIPLGNVTSQLFANIYLHQLDFFIKNNLKIKHYLRYCDDFIIISSDRDFLVNLIQPISDFLHHNLRLSLHPHKIIIRPLEQGIDFLGSILRPFSTTLRTKTQHRMLSRVTSTNRSSYLGLCSHNNSFHLSNTLKLRAIDFLA